ncbi:hypothetical protein F4561_005966 [Lipingzhangella halophila]|uniref:Alpha/beta hydrolase n=1 Tax=Lipingzhangella halophila TaxID=1783352 RepID=A0A7W7RN90_9ACTN|nr:hypothetical protein [Lipingzhangella halophila]MBB4935072.1 hypothetical protein [Lipingzhangella halophila]
MPPGSLVLLHSPLARAEECEAVEAELERQGMRCTLPDVRPADLPPYTARYVARVAQRVGQEHNAGETLGIVARGAAGPLAPQVAAAQRAAKRHVASYVLLNALLPQQGTPTLAELAGAQSVGVDVLEDASWTVVNPDALRGESLPIVHDWPDAPCGYLLTDSRFAHCARLARLRGWPVTDLSEEPPDDAGLAQAVLSMHTELTA